MGMQAKAWSSAELKKKTIKDVNDAIEAGEIEVGDDVGITFEPYNMLWRFGSSTNELFNIYEDQDYGVALMTLESKFAIIDVETELPMINLYLEEDNIFGTIGYDSINDRGIIELKTLDGEAAAFILNFSIDCFYDSTGNWGTEGDVLTCAADGRVVWQAPKKLYQHTISITSSEGNNTYVLSFTVFLNVNTAITKTNIYQLVSSGKEYTCSGVFNENGTQHIVHTCKVESATVTLVRYTSSTGYAASANLVNTSNATTISDSITEVL